MSWKKHMFIVFCCEHYNPLGIIRSLGENGIRPIAIILRKDIQIASKSKYISHLHMVDSIQKGYEILINQYGSQKYGKPFVFTSDDQITSFLDNHYNELVDKFFFFNAGETEKIVKYMDKNRILQLAKKHGLNVLDTVVVAKGEIPSNLEYPIITKAIVSTIDNWKNDMFICNNENELKNAYEQIRSPQVLLQKYIHKKNELCMEGFSVAHGSQTVITIASTYNYILPNSYSPYMTVSNLRNTELENKLKSMIQEIGFEGIFEIEFLRSKDDRLYFGEINFRNSTWSYASTKAGMPLPILWAKSMLRNEYASKCLKEISPPFTAMVEIDDYRQRVKTHMISYRQWVKELLGCKCRYYFSIADIAPVFSVIMYKYKNLRISNKEGKKSKP